MSTDPQGWSLAYRPLRPFSLAVQLVLLVLAEVALYASYSAHDARFHWATHFLVGLAFASLALLAWLLVTGAPEGVNHDVADWLQQRDIAQTRSRPYKKNDQATVESKNNHVVRKHAFYWRYDTPEELTLLSELWPLVSMRLNFFTPTKKPIAYATNANGRRKRIYDKPKTPWQRVLDSGALSDRQAQATQARITDINPADLTRRINQIQLRLTALSRDKTKAMTTSRHLDMASLEASIRRLHTTK